MSSVMRFDEWQDSDGNPVASGAGGAFTAPGSVIAVKDVLKTDTFTASVAAGGNVAVTDLSITHEVSDPANKLIISAFFGTSSMSNGFAAVGIAVNDGSDFIAVGDASGTLARTTAGGVTTGSGSDFVVTMPSVTYVHTPGSGSKTYTVRAVNFAGGTVTIYINRSEGDIGVSPRGVSSLVIQEVAV